MDDGACSLTGNHLQVLRRLRRSGGGIIVPFLLASTAHIPLHVIFVAIAANLHAQKPGPAPCLLAASAVGGTLLLASLVYWTTMREKTSSGPLFGRPCRAGENYSSSIEKIADRLARRDFIYLVVGLAILGKVKWFLGMGAIGAPLYFLVLTALSLKNSSAGSHPIASHRLYNE
jgi:hypothetical protein